MELTYQSYLVSVNGANTRQKLIGNRYNRTCLIIIPILAGGIYLATDSVAGFNHIVYVYTANQNIVLPYRDYGDVVTGEIYAVLTSPSGQYCVTEIYGCA
jgi:hypothetical protein